MFDAPIYICVQNMAFRIVIGIKFLGRVKGIFEADLLVRNTKLHEQRLVGWSDSQVKCDF
jgi:hypothetical protein